MHSIGSGSPSSFSTLTAVKFTNRIESSNIHIVCEDDELDMATESERRMVVILYSLVPFWLSIEIIDDNGYITI